MKIFKKLTDTVKNLTINPVKSVAKKVPEIAKMVKKVFKDSQIVVLNNPSHDERSYKVNFDLISKKFSSIINFKNKNITSDIKKIKIYLKKEKFTLKKFQNEETNRIMMLKKLLKEKKLNKNLRFN